MIDSETLTNSVTITSSGPDTLTLLLSGDQYLGDPEFLVYVNGEQVGGVQSVSAIQVDGQEEQFFLSGSWGLDPTVSLDFINPATNGFIGNGNDRELYIDGVSYDGHSVPVPAPDLTGDFGFTSSVTFAAEGAPTIASPMAPGPVGSALNLVGYHLTYDEEFDAMPTMSPDAGAAEFTTTLAAYPNSQGLRILDNGDQEYYTDSTTGDNPFSVSDGALDITATYVSEGNTPDGGGSTGPSYVSGQITTEGSFSQQYGYFEMRAELPQGAGFWPAFWMLDDNSYLVGGWPPELDVLEAFGATAADGEGGSTQAHWDIQSQNASQDIGNWATLPNGANEYTSFNTYGVLWTPQTIAFYIDGVEIAQGRTPSDYTQEMYMIINLAVGGTWPGDATGENGTLKIDYLRVYSDNSSIPAVALHQISSPDGNSDTNMYSATAAALCFLAGTMIATPHGEQRVEQLKVGQRVTTASGESRPILWIGERHLLATRGRRDAASPVIVRKGAIAPNVPHHDLHVTKGHSFYLDGVLVPVEFLVNHRTILWDDWAQEVTIYHIELETHDVLLANGAPAETYRDDGNRWLFHNENPGWHLPPQAPCAPVHTGGPIVDAIWLRLVERSGPRKHVPLTGDPDLHLMVDGKRLDAIERTGDRYVFRLVKRPGKIRIVSRCAVPQELGFARDARSLGVAIKQMVLAQARRQRSVAAGARSLTDGYHAFEHDTGIRWTDGDAAVPAELFAGMEQTGMLILQLGGTTQYLDDGTAAQAA